MNNHVSLGKRIRYFDVCVTPAILFGLSTLPLRQKDLDMLDILQRQMLRRIIGWRRKDGESWHDTMERMNLRLSHGQSLHSCEDWSCLVLRYQWRYVFHLLQSYPSLWARILANHNACPHADPHRAEIPHRRQARPHQRWDDYLQQLCRHLWLLIRGHWFEILCLDDGLQAYEDLYVDFVRQAQRDNEDSENNVD